MTYLRLVEAEDTYHRLVVLIPEIQPATGGRRCCTTSAASILGRAIRRGTRRVILCRLRYRLETVVDDADAPAKRRAEAPRAPEPK